jgi:esterase/lipase
MFVFTIFIFLLIVLALCAGIIILFVYYAFKGITVTIGAGDYKLKARLYGPNGNRNPRPAILFLSGWNPGNISITPSNFYAGYYAAKNNYICLTLALRGMGSKGDIHTLTRSDFLHDVIAAYDYLATLNGVKKENINMVGESLGGYLACLLSSKRPLNSIALRVPTDFSDEGFNHIPQIKIAGLLSSEWKMQQHSWNESYALSAIHEFKGNLLIVASERDKIVPMQTTSNYLSAVPDSTHLEYFLMKGAGHGLFNPKRQWIFMKILSKWLKKTIDKPAAANNSAGNVCNEHLKIKR